MMTTAKYALEIVSSAYLSPTEHLILKNFIENAVDPEVAARYLSSRIETVRDNVESSLREIKEDWRKLANRLTAFDPIPKHQDALVRQRDGPFCSMSEKGTCGSVSAVEPAHIIPPSMLQDLKLAEDGRLLQMLEAFLSPSHVARLYDLVLNYPNDDDGACLQNLWLLSPMIHEAFRVGYLEVMTVSQFRSYRGIVTRSDENAFSEKYVLCKMWLEEPAGLFLGDGTEFKNALHYFKFSTPDPDTISLPSSFLFHVNQRFVMALHLFIVEEKAARGWPKPSRGFSIPRILRRAFHSLWLYTPVWVRRQCYCYLLKIGRWLYGYAGVPWAQRVPFGLYIKNSFRSGQNEPNALKLIEQHTSIPAPRLVDSVDCIDGGIWLVMTRLQGRPLDEVCHLMSYAERQKFADDLKDCVAQMRRIPNNTPYLFGDTMGGRMVHHRLPNMGSGGPFQTKSEFSNHLSSHFDCPPEEVLGDQAHKLRQDHRSYFTHSDFHPTNLLVDRGALSGILDWECAGYRPEYWEFTKAVYGNRNNEVIMAIMRRAFGDEYERELEVERIFWRWTPFGV